MSTPGLGTDIIEVSTVARLLERRQGGAADRWFTPDEISYCAAKAFPARHFAARLAAKEAVLKALPGRWDGPVPWRAIEIGHDADGKPVVRLLGALDRHARSRRVRSVAVSMSHTDAFATAVALAELDPEVER